jgi:hypothetical protein
MKKFLFFTISMLLVSSIAAMQPETKQKAEVVQDSEKFTIQAINVHQQLKTFVGLPSIKDSYFIPMPDQISKAIKDPKTVKDFNICFYESGIRVIIHSSSGMISWPIVCDPKIWQKTNDDDKQSTDAQFIKTAKTGDKTLIAQLNSKGIILKLDLKVLRDRYQQKLAASNKKA